jgi:hypothetical protein
VVRTLTGSSAPEAARHAQAARLGGLVEAVAGLDLDRRHALAHEHAGTGGGGVEQRCIAGGARGRHGGADATPGAGDGLVAGALQPQLELGRALAGVDEVGVRVHEAGREQRALQIDLAGGTGHGGEIGVGADPGDAPALEQQRAVVDQAPAGVARQGGEPAVAQQRGGWLMRCPSSHSPKAWPACAACSTQAPSSLGASPAHTSVPAASGHSLPAASSTAASWV